MIDATQTNLSTPSSRPAAVQKVARDLEATFLSEMLKSAGFGKPQGAFGGGAGEEQFSSFLARAQADAMVDAGGLGLTEAFIQAMMETKDV